MTRIFTALFFLAALVITVITWIVPDVMSLTTVNHQILAMLTALTLAVLGILANVDSLTGIPRQIEEIYHKLNK